MRSGCRLGTSPYRYQKTRDAPSAPATQRNNEMHKRKSRFTRCALSSGLHRCQKEIRVFAHDPSVRIERMLPRQPVGPPGFFEQQVADPVLADDREPLVGGSVLAEEPCGLRPPGFVI